MPWRKVNVAPYCCEERYVPDDFGNFYYSSFERTPEEKERLYRKMNNGEHRGYAVLPEDRLPEEIISEEPVKKAPAKKSLSKKANAEFTAPKQDLEAKTPKKKIKPPKDYKL